MSIGSRMSSKKNRPQGKPIEREIVQPQIQTDESVHPRVRDYTAPPCSVCAHLRKEKLGGKNCTRVYGTVGNVRYLRCEYCKNTWKDAT
jgi:hypothetical protein